MTPSHKSDATSRLSELREVIAMAENVLHAECGPSHLPCAAVASLCGTARRASHRLWGCVEDLLLALHGRAPGCGPCRFKGGH
jgi:hypothetical protein